MGAHTHTRGRRTNAHLTRDTDGDGEIAIYTAVVGDRVLSRTRIDATNRQVACQTVSDTF